MFQHKSIAFSFFITTFATNFLSSFIIQLLKKIIKILLLDMKRLFSIALLFVFISGSLLAQGKRPKVAVVLSGGGAKGVAHVSALKVIEEAGIPIDMVVGTSMGSLVGGLYACGYTTHQLDSIVNSQNWIDLLLDKNQKTRRSLEMQQKMEPYMVNIDFEKSPFEVIEGGLLKGNSVSYLLSELTADYLKPMSYDDLPTPFACVATDLVTNREVVMKKGILAESLRSSMSIPGAFPPVKLDSMVLVDGGLKNNYPVDVARQMGADYVIGVSVGAQSLGYDNINTTIEVLMQVLDIACANKLEENKANTDVFMHVDVKGYSAASFFDEAIDSLLVRGDKAARGKWDELVALHDKLAEYGPIEIKQRSPKNVHIDYETFTPPSTIYTRNNKASFVGIGARFDNEELASLLLGGEYELNHKNHFRVGASARLGKRIDCQAYTGISPWQKWGIELRYRFSNNETKLYNEGKHVAELNYRKHRVRLDISRSWQKIMFNFGAQFSYVHYNDLLVTDNWAALQQSTDNEKALMYYASVKFNNQDSRLLPTRGMRWLVKYNYATDNGYSFNGKGGVNIVEGYWRMAISLGKSTIINPSIEGRFIQDNNTYLNHCNFIGGIGTFGHYITQQLSFAGINYYQIAPNQLLIGGLNLRQHLSTNNYLFSQFNYGLGSSDLTGIFSQKHLFGAAIGYGYKTPVGPIDLNLNWSNVTKSVGCFLNIGYMF